MICRIEGCGRETKNKNPKHGLCHNHYMRWWHHGDPLINKRNNSLPSKNPNMNDIYWLAGFLEGDGTFSHNRTPVKCEVIQVAQVQKYPLEKARDLFGGTIRRATPRGNQNPYWVFQMSGARARGIMMTLYSLMSPKRKTQIATALQAKPKIKIPRDLNFEIMTR